MKVFSIASIGLFLTFFLTISCKRTSVVSSTSEKSVSTPTQTYNPNKVFDDKIDALYNRHKHAKQRWRNGDRESVITELQKVYLATGEDPNIGIDLARCLSEIGNRVGAMEIYDDLTHPTKWNGTHSRNPRVLLEYAELLRNAGRPAEAKRVIALTETRYEGPSNVRDMRRRGPGSGWTEVSRDEATLNVLAAKECTMLGEYEKAEEYANAALRLRPNDPEAKRWIKTARDWAKTTAERASRPTAP